MFSSILSLTLLIALFTSRSLAAVRVRPLVGDTSSLSRGNPLHSSSQVHQTYAFHPSCARYEYRPAFDESLRMARLAHQSLLRQRGPPRDLRFAWNWIFGRVPAQSQGEIFVHGREEIRNNVLYTLGDITALAEVPWHMAEILIFCDDSRWQLAPTRVFTPQEISSFPGGHVPSNLLNSELPAVFQTWVDPVTGSEDQGELFFCRDDNEELFINRSNQKRRSRHRVIISWCGDNWNKRPKDSRRLISDLLDSDPSDSDPSDSVPGSYPGSVEAEEETETTPIDQLDLDHISKSTLSSLFLQILLESLRQPTLHHTYTWSGVRLLAYGDPLLGSTNTMSIVSYCILSLSQSMGLRLDQNNPESGKIEPIP
ncbi:hypothetical protein EJ05DRAFT_535101 [Pseudovirgaria hyperparasitica]|uniref:Uncharacterized protein n=1 Tax=Pseudovirgaria hyperparasitica TaxID=470096 RepID=A0A6A6WJV1_9PEZI|nr:uncharacterized protein EJ05DRAFT_535101 [Pseudovirgaria hyperparasitica]KAF2761751.1 hypothetical protein EJ05DRAFT_535101 [Pseudovirgaria hyperparasitica]